MALTATDLIAVTSTLQAGETVSIELEGEIEPKCGLDAMADYLELGEIGSVGSKSASFSISCNAPFSYSLHSQEGGLRNTATAPSSSFISLLPYLVGVDIPTNTGSIADECMSSSLQSSPSGCAHSTSGNGVSINQTGSLTISWSVPEELMAGSYTDTLTINVEIAY
jgi:hypothetical protein